MFVYGGAKKASLRVECYAIVKRPGAARARLQLRRITAGKPGRGREPGAQGAHQGKPVTLDAVDSNAHRRGYFARNGTPFSQRNMNCMNSSAGNGLPNR